MNSRAKLRLIALAAGIGLMGLAIVLMTVKSERGAKELRDRLTEVASESFHIADEFRESLRQLNNSLYQFGSTHDPADRDRFLKASGDLNLWIDSRQPKLGTEEERAVMHRIDVAYDDYLRTANLLRTNLESLSTNSATLEDFSDLRKESQRLFDLGQSLAEAHFGSRGNLVAQANQTITALRILVFVSLGCLFVFGIALAAVVFRDMIAPLRLKLVESQALIERQEKLASLGMLAAGVAHEIRNPLTAIKAALFIQQKGVQPGTKAFADAKIVEREILRLERIVSDFLHFARPAEPHLTKVPADVPLREVETLLAPQLARSNVGLIFEGSPPLWISVDLAQIKQVLINLVQNAADAVGEGGLVKLRARQDRKRLGNAERSVVILEVTDNGKGIPPDVQKRLFDPFFTTKDSGTGLGLSIADGIVRKHGGAMQYQTQMDCGTTFGIILPQSIE